MPARTPARSARGLAASRRPLRGRLLGLYVAPWLPVGRCKGACSAGARYRLPPTSARTSARSPRGPRLHAEAATPSARSARGCRLPAARGRPFESARLLGCPPTAARISARSARGFPAAGDRREDLCSVSARLLGGRRTRRVCLHSQRADLAARRPLRGGLLGQRAVPRLHADCCENPVLGLRAALQLPPTAARMSARTARGVSAACRPLRRRLLGGARLLGCPPGRCEDVFSQRAASRLLTDCCEDAFSVSASRLLARRLPRGRLNGQRAPPRLPSTAARTPARPVCGPRLLTGRCEDACPARKRLRGCSPEAARTVVRSACGPPAARRPLWGVYSVNARHHSCLPTAATTSARSARGSSAAADRCEDICSKSARLHVRRRPLLGRRLGQHAAPRLPADRCEVVCSVPARLLGCRRPLLRRLLGQRAGRLPTDRCEDVRLDGAWHPGRSCTAWSARGSSAAADRCVDAGSASVRFLGCPPTAEKTSVRAARGSELCLVGSRLLGCPPTAARTSARSARGSSEVCRRLRKRLLGKRAARRLPADCCEAVRSVSSPRGRLIGQRARLHGCPPIVAKTSVRSARGSSDAR